MKNDMVQTLLWGEKLLQDMDMILEKLNFHGLILRLTFQTIKQGSLGTKLHWLDHLAFLRANGLKV